MAVIIKTRMNNTRPSGLFMSISSILCFAMSIAWINFAANCVVDLLKTFGMITGLPQALLNLTVLAWGNSLGDVSADVAMAKRGFGEMAITATVAAPIFNILVGTSVSSFKTILSFEPSKNFLRFSYLDEDGKFDKQSVNLIVLIIGTIVVILLGVINGIVNKFNLQFKFTILSILIYFASIAFLCTYALLNNLATE
mmetsp:Transcript_14726/g.25058  ORF Transcript_14726/g.25058 Transcript_14726/m.25058 type:complete len:197 (+) Transcript_14726:1666-2256(+)